MNDLIKINFDNDRATLSARELHEFLEVKEAYTEWFDRMAEYGFTNGSDFIGFYRESTGGRPSTDHEITIDMAKELCMIQRTEKGKQARQYFIQVEKEYNTPEKIMARALRIADETINGLRAMNARLEVENEIQRPKAEYFDELVNRNLLTNFRDTAKEFGIRERDFIAALVQRKYIYRTRDGKLMPYADRYEGLFEIKECFNEATNWRGVQTLITPKGRETFRLLLEG